MKIVKRYDCTTGGYQLKARRGCMVYAADLWYSPKARQWILAGSVNRRCSSPSKAQAEFTRFVRQPDVVDPGTPPRVSEVCLDIPAGLDPLELMEAPRCKGRKQLDQVLQWHRKHGGL